jgi:thymidylate kinase
MNRTIRFSTVILATLLSCLEVAVAQRSAPAMASFSGAALLVSAGVDTTDFERITQIADSTENNLTEYAILFLAQHGFSNVGAKIQSRFFACLGEHKWKKCWIYLAALYATRDPNTYSFGRSLLDTMIVDETAGRATFHPDDFVDVIDLLLDYKDFSRYDFFKSLFGRTPRPSAPILLVFGTFSESPILRDQAFRDVRPYLKDGDQRYRSYAVQSLIWFQDYPERIDLLREAALTDGSAQVRDQAIEYLLECGDIGTVVQACEMLATQFADKVYSSGAIFRLTKLNTPSALASLIRIKNSLAPGPLQEDAALCLDTYKPRGFAQSQPLLASLDSLVSFDHQSAQLGWLADANFVKELDNGLENAKKHLANKDSVNAYKEVQTFQDKVNKEYEKTVDDQKKRKSRDKRFVTVEGWKILYYNAQYIMDRLPSTVSMLLDDLRSQLSQLLTKGLIGDAPFVKGLDNGLENAKKRLSKPDSVNCYNEVATFQDEVNKEYLKTVDDDKKAKARDKRFVTAEGWQVLYYGAQEIMDRLPSEKKK